MNTVSLLILILIIFLLLTTLLILIKLINYFKWKIQFDKFKSSFISQSLSSAKDHKIQNNNKLLMSEITNNTPKS